jgi:uncharacterized protein (DUF736 family)
MASDSIGALWVKTSKNGKKFMSGKVEVDGKTVNIVVFKNEKTSEKQPDYRILESVPQSQQDRPEPEDDSADLPFS